MSSADVFYFLGDCCYWIFENILEPLGDMPWMIVLIAGFGGFLYWMKRQMDYNKQAEGDSTQLK